MKEIAVSRLERQSHAYTNRLRENEQRKLFDSLMQKGQLQIYYKEEYIPKHQQSGSDEEEKEEDIEEEIEMRDADFSRSQSSSCTYDLIDQSSSLSMKGKNQIAKAAYQANNTSVANSAA